ncbi:DsbA family protein [Patescibacteria group bacterium]|nr:DsbA family protein [Patescibacteria group bacterium]
MPKKTTPKKSTSLGKKSSSSSIERFSLPLNKNYGPILYILLLVAAFFLGSLTTKVSYLEKGGKTTGPEPTTTAAAQQQAAQQAPKVELATIKKVFDNKEVIKFGDANKKLLLVEVADPSCPFCQAAAGKNPELNKQMGAQFTLVSDGGTYISPVQEMRKLVESGQASFAFIYQNGHGNGEMAMKALFCANDQDKFWDAHDKLNTNEGYNLINNEVKNDKSASGKLSDFLSGTLDSSALKSCLDGGKYDSYIANNQKLAASMGVNGTPGFFINSTNFAGAYSWKDMQSVADAALK